MAGTDSGYSIMDPIIEYHGDQEEVSLPTTAKKSAIKLTLPHSFAWLNQRKLMIPVLLILFVVLLLMLIIIIQHTSVTQSGEKEKTEISVEANVMGNHCMEKCRVYNSNPCRCKGDSACEYNTATDKCIAEKRHHCEEDEFKAPYDCKREGEQIFYSIGGVICHSDEASGNCRIEKTVIALNFYGPNVTNARGIGYINSESFPVADIDDPQNILMPFFSYPFVHGIPRDEEYLYKDIAYFSALHERKYNAYASFWLPTDGDGRYELSLKTAEVYWDNMNSRSFSYLLNGKYIVRELDLLVYRPKYWAFELNTNFRIFNGGTMIQIMGQEATEIRSDGKLNFTVSMGRCGKIWTQNWEDTDPNSELAAMSLVKFV